MNLLESLEDELGLPLIDWEGSTVHAHRQPIVYLWLRGETVLYIGQSSNGVERPLGKGHERIRDIEPTDRLIVFAMKTARLAVLCEDRLIRRLSPQLNAGGWHSSRHKLTVSENALRSEERSLERQLAAVRQQLAGLHSVQEARERKQQDRIDNRESLHYFDVANPEYLSPQRAASMVGVKAGTLRAAVRTGTLRAVRFGVKMRFKAEWIEEWLIATNRDPGETANTQALTAGAGECI